ncbi:MAG: hypothetical protein ACI8TQ_003392 [Planctomycetota bacterium]|jgi:hypothetical protein
MIEIQSSTFGLQLCKGLQAVKGLWLIPVLLLVSGCRTQLWPGPMVNTIDPLPKGVDSDTPAGLVEVLVYRHADPVQVRRPESPTAFPLTFFRKNRRMHSGAWVHCGAGGRAEVLWPTDGARVLMYDDSVCRIGEPSRGEPAVRFEHLTRAEITLSPGAITQLPGGAQLSGPPNSEAGPYLVQQVYSELLRIFNQSGEPAYLRFREDEIVIGAGERVDIPLLGAGGSPIDLGASPREIRVGWRRGQVYGDVEVTDESGRMRLSSPSGRGVVMTQGIALRLKRGDSALLLDLGEIPATTVEPPTPENPAPEDPDLETTNLDVE